MNARNNPRNVELNWKTDTTKHAVPLNENNISKSKQIGSVTVFDPRIEEKLLTFKKTKKGFADDETGSV